MVKFITFEGCEGAGKSTQAALLAESFKKAQIEVVLTREPGGTKASEVIREILLNKDIQIKPTTELLLINAARYEHVQDVILPAVKSGKIVICDRFVDSTMAYQGFAHRLGKKLPAIIHNFIFPEIVPEMTFIIDVDTENGIARSKNANHANKFESLDIEFHDRARRAFIEIARNAADRCTLLDGAKSIKDLHEDVISVVNSKTIFDLKA